MVNGSSAKAGQRKRLKAISSVVKARWQRIKGSSSKAQHQRIYSKVSSDQVQKLNVKIPFEDEVDQPDPAPVTTATRSSNLTSAALFWSPGAVWKSFLAVCRSHTLPPCLANIVLVGRVMTRLQPRILGQLPALSITCRGDKVNHLADLCQSPAVATTRLFYLHTQTGFY